MSKTQILAKRRNRRNTNVASEAISLERELAEELERLKGKVGMGYELQVRWLPAHKKMRDERELRGEVKGSLILIYDKELEDAIETLRHEFIEWVLDQINEPYRRLVNLLIKSIEIDAYLKREFVAKRLEKLLL